MLSECSEENRYSLKKGCPVCDTKLLLVVRLPFETSGTKLTHTFPSLPDIYSTY